MITKRKLLLSLLISVLPICLESCDHSKNQVVIETNEVLIDNESDKTFKIVGENIVIRKGPGRKFDKVLNQKATKILHKNQYATVDYSCEIKEYEAKNGWSKIVVVKPDWLSESHKGWIETKYIVKDNNPQSSNSHLKKIKIFNDVQSVVLLLSDNGIGPLRQWHNDEISWFSSTDYYSFGTFSSSNNMNNNLAYYLESENEFSIEIVKLVLNINNQLEKLEALSLMNITSKKTFFSLGILFPKNLSDAIKSGRTFKDENSDYKISLDLNKSKIETWELIIETK